MFGCASNAIDLLIAGDRRAVIDEHPHTHPAIGRPHQRVGEQPPGFVAAKNEILKIQSLFGGIDHLRAGQESIDSDGDNSKCGIAVSLPCGMSNCVPSRVSSGWASATDDDFG